MFRPIPRSDPDMRVWIDILLGALDRIDAHGQVVLTAREVARLQAAGIPNQSPCQAFPSGDLPISWRRHENDPMCGTCIAPDGIDSFVPAAGHAISTGVKEIYGQTGHATQQSRVVDTQAISRPLSLE